MPCQCFGELYCFRHKQEIVAGRHPTSQQNSLRYPPPQPSFDQPVGFFPADGPRSRTSWQTSSRPAKRTRMGNEEADTGDATGWVYKCSIGNSGFGKHTIAAGKQLPGVYIYNIYISTAF